MLAAISAGGNSARGQQFDKGLVRVRRERSTWAGVAPRFARSAGVEKVRLIDASRPHCARQSGDALELRCSGDRQPLGRLLALRIGAVGLGARGAGLRATAGAVRLPDRIHVLVGDGFPHAGHGVVGVARVLLRPELEDVQAVRVLIDAEVLTERGRSGPRDAQLVGEVEGRPVELLLEVHLPDRCGVHDLTPSPSRTSRTGRASACLTILTLTVSPSPLIVGGEGVQFGKHLLARLAGLDALLDAVHVGVADLRVLGDVRLKRQERADLGACVPAGSATRLEQLGDVGVLAVHEREDVLRSLRRDRQARGWAGGRPAAA